MIKQKEQNLPAREKALAVVRTVSEAFREVADFDPFVRGLEAALGKAEFFDKAVISLLPKSGGGEEKGENFPPATLCLPLQESPEVPGMIRFSDGRREFGPGDLHLMSGLAELIGVLTQHALQFGEQRRNLALLGFLLNQVPVGVLCFAADGRIIVSNTPGRRLLGGAAQGESWLLPEDWVAEIAGVDATGEIHRTVEGRLLHGQVKPASSGSGEDLYAMVVTDLTSDQEKFREVLARETYRCAWLGRALSVVTITAAQPSRLLSLLRPLREHVGAAGQVGLLDAETIGLFFSETALIAAMAEVRQVRSLLADDWEAGVAEIGSGPPDPEALLQEALGSRRRLGDLVKRSLLLHDDYGSVNDMLEMILKQDFRVVKSNDFEQTVRQLGTGRFDGLFTELELSNGMSGLDLARLATEANPRIRAFLTSAVAFSRRDEEDFAAHILFQKPFDVNEVRGAVRKAFA